MTISADRRVIHEDEVKMDFCCMRLTSETDVVFCCGRRVNESGQLEELEFIDLRDSYLHMG